MNGYYFFIEHENNIQLIEILNHTIIPNAFIQELIATNDRVYQITQSDLYKMHQQLPGGANYYIHKMKDVTNKSLTHDQVKNLVHSQIFVSYLQVWQSLQRNALLNQQSSDDFISVVLTVGAVVISVTIVIFAICSYFLTR